MKILLLADHLDIGAGIGRTAYNITATLLDQGHQCTVLVTKQHSTEKYINQELLHGKKDGILDYIKMIFRIRQLIKEHDVVQCIDGYPYSAYAYLASLGLPNKLFIIGIGTYTVHPLHHWLKRFILARAYRKAHTIFCISNYTKQALLEHLPDLQNIQVVHLGVNFGAPLDHAKSISRHPSLISVGMLKHRKGQHVTVDALRILKPLFPNLQLTLVGSQANEKYVEKLKIKIKQYGLEDSVIFYQNVSDNQIKELYQGATIFVMPSISQNDNFEGFGLVYLEANHYGIPVIGCLETGAEDAIKDGVTGFLVPQNNPEAIAEKVQRLLTNPKLYTTMSREAFQWSRQFTWQSAVEVYCKAYSESL